MDFKSLINNITKNFETNQKILFIISLSLICAGAIYFLFIEGKPSFNQNAPVATLIKEIGLLKFDDLRKINIIDNRIIKNNFTIKTEYPGSLNVYGYRPKTFNESETKNLTTKLEVSINKNVKLKNEGNVILANKDSKNLTIYIDLGSFIYINDEGFFENKVKNFDGTESLDDYKQKAIDFYNSLGLSLEGYEFTSYGFHLAGVHPETATDLKDSQLIEFVFTSKKDNIELIGFQKDLISSNISISIDKNGVVRKIYGILSGEIKDNQGSVPLKSEAELKASILNGDASLVGSSFDSNEVLTEVVINSALLKYYNKGSRIVPIYVLDAKLTNSKGEVEPGTFYIDALKR